MKRVTILKIMIGVIALCQSSVAMSSQVNNKKKVNMFINTKWIAVSSIDKISADAIKLLVSKFHDKDHRLANVAGPYNHSYFVDGRPRRRLILAGNYGKYWFIYYELGEIASTKILVLMDLNSVSNKILFTANGMAGMQDQLGVWKTGIADINKALNNNTILLMKTKNNITNLMLPNNRLKLTAHLGNFVSARSLAWALGGPKSDLNELYLTGRMVSHTIPP